MRDLPENKKNIAHAKQAGEGAETYKMRKMHKTEITSDLNSIREAQREKSKTGSVPADSESICEASSAANPISQPFS